MSTFQLQSSEMLARLKPFGITFEKSLNDLIRGIRLHSKDSPEALLTFMDNAIQECKDELATTDLEVKATAVLKLAYLEMYGYDMSWCNFHILEVMLSAKFQHKRIGYLAASQSFKSERELLILATNQFKKDLNSHNHVEIGLALSGIATIVTPNLAKDIVDDIVMKLSHLKPYIRKKAVLALFKVFLQYPESWKLAAPRVIEKLDDPDVSVVSATITVVCEILKQNPSAFLGYLPKFFTILEDTANNWLIIRILKLFQSLLKIEPRMKKRIMPSIVGLMTKTDATSLIYESINCIVDGGMLAPDSSRDKEVAKLCVEHLLRFFERQDANLRFVGLLALIKILKIYPSFIRKNTDIHHAIRLSLDAGDLIIKRKALEICHYLVTEDNIAEVVKSLLLQLLPQNTSSYCPESFKIEITNKVLEIAATDNYANIPNFKWYVTVLKELVNLTILADASSIDSKVALSSRNKKILAQKIGAEFKSLAMKVPSVRPFLMSRVVLELTNSLFLLQTCPSLLDDLYWIMGEYTEAFGFEVTIDEDLEFDQTLSLSQKVTAFNNFSNAYMRKKAGGDHLSFALSDEIVKLEDPNVITSFIDLLVKLYSAIVTDYVALYSVSGEMDTSKVCELGYFLRKLIHFLENWELSPSYEVQEACLPWIEFLKLCSDAMGASKLGGIAKLEREEIEYYTKRQVEEQAAHESDTDGSESDDDESEDDDDDDDESEEDDDEEEEEEDEEDEEEEEDGDDGLDTEETNPKLDASDSTNGFTNESKSPETSTSEAEVPEKLPLPALMTEVLSSFFKSYHLNPVSANAQSRIPLPKDLDLDTQIHHPPAFCLEPIEYVSSGDSSDEEDTSLVSEATDTETLAKDRLERLKDDPYYIMPSKKKPSKKAKASSTSLPADVASSEATKLDLSNTFSKPKKARKEKVLILTEDTFGDEPAVEKAVAPKVEKKKKNRLIIDSVNLGNLTLGTSDNEKESHKDFEYEVNLEAMRTQLAEKASKPKKKKKPKKEALNTELTESVEETSAKSPSPVVPAKTKKKKKKAVIVD